MHFKDRSQLFWRLLSALMLGLTSVSVLAADTASQETFAIERQSLDEAVSKAIEASDYLTTLVLQAQIVETTSKTRGADHLDTALALGNLAWTYSKLEQHDKALPLRQRTLAIREKVLGLEHTDTALALSNLAWTYSMLEKHDKALPVEQLVLAIREKVLGMEHPDTALALSNLAWTYSKLEQHNKALPLRQRALEILEKVLGSEHPDTALAINYLASTYSDLTLYEKALQLEQRALAIQEKVLGMQHPDTALTLNNLASTYSQLAQYDKALLLQQRALEIWEKVLGPEHPTTALALNNLARTYSELAQYDKALPLQQRALSIWEKVLGPEHTDTAIALNNLASTYSELAQYDKALPLQQRALEIWEKVLGSEHTETGRALNNLASTYSKLAQYDKALPLQQRSLAMLEKVLGSEHPYTASALGNLAWIYFNLAQYDKALILQLRALVIWERNLDPEHPNTASALSNLAAIYSKLSQYDKALPLQQRALAIQEKVMGPDHRRTALALHNLAFTYSQLAQHDKALPLHQRALAIREKSLGMEHPETAWSLNDLAGPYFILAQYDKALLFQQGALDIWEKVLGPDHPNTALAISNMAEIYSKLSENEKALSLKQRALAIRERSLGEQHPDTADSYYQLGQIYLKLGLSTISISFQKMAVNTLQKVRQTVSHIGNEELRSYTQSVESVYQSLIDLLLREDRLAEAQLVFEMLKEHEQFDFIRRSSSADPRRRLIEYTEHEQQWMGRYRQIADKLFKLGQEEQALQKLAKSSLTPEQKIRLQELAANLQISQSAFESFLNDLRTNLAQSTSDRSAEFAETSTRSLRDLQSLLKGLGGDTALVQYFITENQVGMLITTGAVQKAHQVKIEAKELSRKIADFRRQLNDPKSNPQPLAQELYQLLFAPIANDLQQAGIRNVMLSPDGVLRYVPFAALHDGQVYLLQRFNLPLYTSVARERLLEAVSPNWRAAGLGVTRQHGEFSPLPAVKAEMDSIIKTGSRGVLPGEVHLDEAFTAKKLQEVGQRRFPVMHIASHFRFSPGTEINSFLLLGDGQRLTLGDLRTQNYRFDGVDLLTLSACETGLGGGRDARGREIEGFGVIAQQQGANAVLATLWPVADQSTSLLMTEMYRLRQERNLNKAEALRQAQILLQKQGRYAHPYYWAPFILMGNWK